MQSKVESLSSIKKKINFEIPAQRVSAEIDKAYAQIRKQAAIKGFRKGKVPMSLIEKHYGEQMADDVLKTLVNETYFQALGEHGINPVGYPTIEGGELKPGEPLTYSATVETFPQVELKEYAGLELQKEQFIMDEAAVDARLKEMQENMAQLVPAPEGHAAALGDFVTSDFTGSLDGVPFEGGAAEDFQLELGSGRFIPGFEEQMVGMTVGHQGTIKVTFPENYGNKELAGKEAEFAITVKEIKQKELPELNDEFAKEFGDFESLAELRQKVAEYYQSQEENRIQAELKERLYKALVEKNDLEVPETLVDRQVESMLEGTKQRLASQRMTLEMVGMNEDTYRVQFREVGRDQVKGSLIVDAVATKEGIEVDQEEVNQQYANIAQYQNQDAEKIAAFYEGNERAKESLMAQMREDKTVAWLLAQAKVVEVPKDEIKK